MASELHRKRLQGVPIVRSLDPLQLIGGHDGKKQCGESDVSLQQVHAHPADCPKRLARPTAFCMRQNQKLES